MSEKLLVTQEEAREAWKHTTVTTAFKIYGIAKALYGTDDMVYAIALFSAGRIQGVREERNRRAAA